MGLDVTHACGDTVTVWWADGGRWWTEQTTVSGPWAGDVCVWREPLTGRPRARCRACGWVWVQPKRQTHLTRAKGEYDLAMIQWEQDRERELRGHLHDRPERGESLPLSEQRFRERFPRPVWADYVKNVGVSGMSHANNHGMVGV